ncbi:MAG: hypothetical protein HY040_10455 [Planctomycetes bacterium]|nr:hypothetical protein [Planctomycetota bacterium]
MKKMLLVFLLGAILFGGSAVASFFMRQKEAHPTDDTMASNMEKGVKKVPVQHAPGHQQEQVDGKLAVRPAATPSPENIVQLASNLRQQQESIQKREQQLQTRQKHIEMIYQDIRTERKGLDEVRLQINEEMKTLQDKMENLEKKAAEIGKQRQKMSDQEKDVKQALFEVDGVEQKSIKQLAAMCDSMEPDVAGEFLSEMADKGKIDAAAKILASMKERQAARVLSQIADRTVAVQIMDKMRSLKRSTN